MGERSYAIMPYEGEQHAIEFSDDDDWLCLCTFPHNDQGHLEPERVRSLALLGAAVVLGIWRPQYLNQEYIDAGWGTPHIFLPGAVPLWIREEIQRIVPVEDD